MKAVGIIGPKNCYNKRKKVKETIFKLKTVDPNLVILSGGNDEGIEKDVKETAINFGLEYKEFNPAFTERNSYSMLGEEYFNKNYHYTYLMERYDRLMRETDLIIIGYDEDATSVDPLYYKFIQRAQKKNKKIVFI